MNIRHRIWTFIVTLVVGLIAQSNAISTTLAQQGSEPETPAQPAPAQDAGAAADAPAPEVAAPVVQDSAPAEPPAPVPVSAPSPEPEPAPPTAAAGDLGGLEALLGESVVTTASRSAERASTAPSTVYSITAEELHTFGIRSIDEALSYLGLGVYVSSARDYSTGIDVGAQGVLLRDTGKHMLGLIDGHAMNSQVYGGVSINEAFGVPLEAIDHIEVMLGAGSVVYGSNAMLLVVNVVTRRARDYKGAHVSSEFGLAAPHRGKNLIGGGSDSRVGLRYRLGASGAATFGEDADLMLAAEWLDDHSNSYGVGPYSGGPGFILVDPESGIWGGDAYHRMMAPSGVLKARYRDFRLLLQANHYERGIPLVGAFRHPDAIEQQDAFRVDLRHSADLSPHFTLGSRLYGDHHSFSESTLWPGVGVPPFTQRSARASWLGLEEQLAFDWYLDGSASTMLGFDLRGRSTHTDPGESRDDAEGPRLPSVEPRDAGGFLGAVFAQQVWKPMRWLTLNGGARFDADTEFSGHVSPRAAVTVEPTDSTSIRTSYSEAFRGPTRYELDDTDNAYRITPLSLRPETVRVVELELQQRLSAITFSVRGFASFYSDFIFTRPATEEELAAAIDRGNLNPDLPIGDFVVVVNDNLATIRSYGVSPSVTLRLGRGVQAGATFNYAHSRIDRRPLAVMPSVFGNARISWQPVPDGVTIAAAALIAGKRRVVHNDIATPLSIGPQLDLKATLSGPTGLSGLRFRVSLTYVHNPYLPYTPLDVAFQPPGEPRLLIPVIARLQGFLGLQYDYAP